MSDLTVVYWLYADPAPLRVPRNYTAAHVNAQLPMLARHMPEHRVVVITDQTDGLDPSVEVLAPPVEDDGPVNPTVHRRYPSCLRRLWNFSAAAKVLGSRILASDLDTLYVRDMRPLLDRDEPLVVWRVHGEISGAAYLLDTGSHAHVWDLLDLATAPQILARAKLPTSDQGWLNYTLPLSTPAWGEREGAWVPPLGSRVALPESARLVSFGTEFKPWDAKAFDRFDWLGRHYEVPK